MRKKILISDDVAFFRENLKDILAKGGFEVIGEASNGGEAVELAKTLKPDIVILDIVMPVKTGLEAAKEISQMKLPLKIVMCTSLGYEPVVEEAIRSGASGYILKPLNEEKVLSVLKNL